MTGPPDAVVPAGITIGARVVTDRPNDHRPYPGTVVAFESGAWIVTLDRSEGRWRFPVKGERWDGRRIVSVCPAP